MPTNEGIVWFKIIAMHRPKIPGNTSSEKITKDSKWFGLNLSKSLKNLKITWI